MELCSACHPFYTGKQKLVDTAGRSPKDEVRIQELKAFLGEAAADEVHLVLSSVAAARRSGSPRPGPCVGLRAV